MKCIISWGNITLMSVWFSVCGIISKPVRITLQECISDNLNFGST